MNDRVEIVEPITLELVDEHTTTPPPHALTVSAPQSPMAMMMQAKEMGVSLEMLERMWELETKYNEREAKKAFVTAMSEFKTMPLVIFKKKRVGYETKDGDFVGYTHAELSDVTDVVSPAMAQHGLSYRWDVKQEGGRVHVACIVTHKLGHSESVTMDAAPDDSGKKNKIQQIASALTYCQRYTLLAVTGMSTKGMDDDGNGSGDADADRRRTQWIKDQIANINGARNVGELKSIMAYAIAKVREEKDQDAEDQLLAAHGEKISTAKPKEPAHE